MINEKDKKQEEEREIFNPKVGQKNFRHIKGWKLSSLLINQKVSERPNGIYKKFSWYYLFNTFRLSFLSTLVAFAARSDLSTVRLEIIHFPNKHSIR